MATPLENIHAAIVRSRCEQLKATWANDDDLAEFWSEETNRHLDLLLALTRGR